MIDFNKLGSAAAAALVLLITAAPTSWAFHTGDPYDAIELKCRKTISKTFTKAVQTGQKLVAGCHKSKNKSGGAGDCNVIDLANADPKGKFTKAKDKIASGLQKTCTDAGVGVDIAKEYISCPEPCSTDLGLPNPLTSFAEIAQCLGCYAGDIAENFGLATQGGPTAPMTSEADQACHIAIGKGFGKYLAAIMKERTKCQNTAEKKEGALHLEDTGCITADPKGKIAAALTKANSGVSSACSAATLANLDSCSDVDLANLQGCLASEAESAADKGVAGSYELEATICPTRVDALVRGRKTINGETTNTRLELGWTGSAHNADLQDNYLISVDVECQNASPPCGDCDILGVSADGAQYNSFLRCQNNLSVQCNEPFANDADDCGGEFCTYVLGPPLPVSAGNNPVCSINRLKTDITGTSNPETGEGELNISLSTLVNLGVIGLTYPCGVCGNDPVPQDGVRGGVCEGEGPRDGLSCDIQGFSAAFAPPKTCLDGDQIGNPCVDDSDCVKLKTAGVDGVCAQTKGLSLDCPPSPLKNISGAGLNIDLALTTGASSLAFENKCDGALSFLDCACGVCSGDESIPCRNDTECDVLGAGTCTSIGSGLERVPNACNDGDCAPIGGGYGVCLAGPKDLFCDGAVTVDGDGYIGCSTNTDCDVVKAACGGDCGNCIDVADAKNRPCFLDPIVAVGTPSTENPTLVSTFCLPPTNNDAINGVSGQPGPVRVTVNQLTQLHY